MRRIPALVLSFILMVLLLPVPHAKAASLSLGELQKSTQTGNIGTTLRKVDMVIAAIVIQEHVIILMDGQIAHAIHTLKMHLSENMIAILLMVEFNVVASQGNLHMMHMDPMLQIGSIMLAQMQLIT